MVLLTRCIDFGEKYVFNEELSIEFSVAGHILGAASARLEISEGGKKRYVGFTGDLGNYQSKLVPDPQPMENLDYLITESTYGGRMHQNVGDPGSELLHYIEETCIRKGGKLIIPAFSVGRTQAIIFTLNELYSQGRLPEVNIFTDSPLAIRSTTTYQSNYKYLNAEALEFQKKYHSLFNFPQLHIIDNDKESEMLSAMPGAAVIISAAGMVEGGRIQMHVRNNIGYEENTILIAGFCAEGTLGHRLMQGQEFIEINHKKRPAKAAVHKTDAFSAHPDHAGLLRYIEKSLHAGMKGVFLVHADAVQMDLLAKDIPFEHVHTPAKGDEFILD
jgi:metallo-beta-lactamase family protein